MTTTTPHYEEGSEAKIAVVLSCPGQEEEKAQKPAAGQSGENLKEVLSNLRNIYGLNDFERGKITITNAWDKVEYKGKTPNKPTRTEADDKEILGENNLNRLADEIKDITDFILCCGNKAKIAVLALQQQGKLNQNCGIIEVPHLGNQGTNKTIKEDVSGDRIISGDKTRSSSNRILRLEVVAKKIYEQIVFQKKIKEDIEDWKLRISTLYSSVKNWALLKIDSYNKIKKFMEIKAND
jgi:hypothetical protein